MVDGLNTDIEHQGRTYHVQTEGVDEPEAMVQSLIYVGGQLLVRMTASYAELMERFRLNGDDVRHALELQHWNLVRKIRHGMLDDDETPPPYEPVVSPLRGAALTSRAECDDPAVRELLAELDRRIDETAVELPGGNPAPPAPQPGFRQRLLSWLRR